MSATDLPAAGIAVAEQFAAWAVAVHPAALPDAVRKKAAQSLLDVAGLCLAARRLDYVGAVLNSCESEGTVTAIGHTRALDMVGAALVNGTAAKTVSHAQV